LKKGKKEKKEKNSYHINNHLYLSIETMSSVVLFFQRSSGVEDDFVVRISRENDIYSIDVKEKDLRDPARHEHEFEDLDHLLNYVSILTYQVINDADVQNPFTHFQYCIPFFPTVIVPIPQLRKSAVYDRFQQALEFYLGD